MGSVSSHVERRPLARVLVVAWLAFGTVGCKRIEQWLNTKADEKIAHELDTVSDDLDDDDAPTAKTPGKAQKKKRKAVVTGAANASDDPLSKPPVPTLAPAPALDYVDDVASAVNLFKEKLPGAKFTEILIYPTYGTATMEDPKNKGSVLEFNLRNGHVSGGKPPLIAPQDVAAALFDVATLNLDVTKAIVKDAPVRTGLATKTAAYIIIERDVPFSNDMVYRVYLDGGEKCAEYDEKGKFIQTL